MEIIPFKHVHLQNIMIQNMQSDFDKLLVPETVVELERGGYTVIDDGEILACLGLAELSPNRALAWAYISQNIGRKMLQLTRIARRMANLSLYRRIEVDVDCDFEQAHRWAKMLGCTLECERRRAYTPDGRDCALYARVL